MSSPLITTVLLLISFQSDYASTSRTLLLKRCPRGIKNLAGYAADEYTDCTGDVPVIRKCEEGYTYSKEKGECHVEEFLLEKRAEMNGQHERVALGEVVKIGSLFDVRKGVMYNGFNMWNKDTLEAKTMERAFETSTTSYLKETGDRDKAKNMDIGVDVELDFLSGMLSIKGSAKYMADKKDTTNKERIVMKAQVTKKISDIDIATPIDNDELCEMYQPNSGPTHVVVRVKEGIRSFFVFDKVVNDENSSHDISGDLQAHVMCIPSMSVEGGVVIDSNGKEVTNSKKIDVQFYGDALLTKFPVTYKEAAIAYKETMEKAPKTTPISFHLVPLSTFCTGSDAPIVDSLTSALVNTASQYLADLSEVEAKVNTLLQMDAAQRYDAVSAPLNKFQSELDIFTTDLKSKIAEEVPKIKSEEDHESALSDILVEYEDSKFEKSRSMAFLRYREREINMISYTIDKALNQPLTTLSDEVNAKDNECMFNGEFGNQLILGMLPTGDLVDSFLESTGDYEEVPRWYEEDGPLAALSYLKNSFEEYASVNSLDDDKTQCFLLKLQASSEGHVREIHLLKGGDEFATDFIPPPQPPKPICPQELISADSFTVRTERSDSVYVSGQEVILEQVVSAEETRREYIRANNTGSVVIENLLPYSQYRVWTRYTVHTDQGYSVLSPYTDCITRPTSPPSVLSISHATSSSLTLSWYRPEKINPGLRSKSITYHVKVNRDEIRVKTATTRDHTFTVDNLDPGTLYRVSITAQPVDDNARYPESQAAIEEFVTGPVAPTVRVVSSDQYSCAVMVSVPRVVSGTSLDKIDVKFYGRDGNGVVADSEKHVVQLLPAQTGSSAYSRVITISPLTPQTEYYYEARISVSSGVTSSYSSYSTTDTCVTQSAEVSLSNALVHLQDTTVHSLGKVSTQISEMNTYTDTVWRAFSEAQPAIFQTMRSLRTAFENLEQKSDSIQKSKCEMEGLKYSDTPIATIDRVASLRECLEACGVTDECEAVSVDNQNKVRTCYLYDKRGGDMEIDMDFVSANFICYATSSVRGVEWDSCTDTSTVYSTVPLSTTSGVTNTGECLASCQTVDNCQGITMTPDGNGTYTCSASPTRKATVTVSNDDVYSVNVACLEAKHERKGCTLEDKTVLASYRIRVNSGVRSLDACVETCYNDDNCVTVSFTSIASLCELHSTRPHPDHMRDNMGTTTLSLHCLGLKNI